MSKKVHIKIKGLLVIRFISLSILLFAGQLWADTHKQLNIAVLAIRGNDVMFEMWQPLADYLGEQLPGYKFSLIPVTNDNISKVVGEGNADFVLTNAGSYAALESTYGISRIATLRNERIGKSYTRFGAVIFTRADRDDLDTLQDLKNQRFMAIHPKAFGGWWMAWRELRQQGLDPKKDFSSLEYSGFPQDKTVYAVRDRKVDSGTVRTDTLERMSEAGLINLKDYKVLNRQYSKGFEFMHSTMLYPEWPFSVVSHTSETIAHDVALALLNLPEDHPVAQASKSKGWTVPQDYQPVHDLMKELRVGPYINLNRVSFLQAIVAFWPWLLALTILSMALYTYNVMLMNRRIRKSEARLNYAQKTANMASWEYDVRSKKLLISKQVPNILCIDDEIKIRYSDVISRVHPDDREEHLDLHRKLTNHGEGFSFEYRIVCPDGFEKVLYEKNNAVTNERGDVVRLRGTVQDISKRKKMENALFQEKEKAQVTLYSIADAVITTDITGRIEYMNLVAEEMAEKSLDMAIGNHYRNVFDFIYEDDRRSIFDLVYECLQKSDTIELPEGVLLATKNKEYTVKITIAPMKDKNSNVIGTVLVVHDISEAHMMAQKLNYQSTHDALTGLINRFEFNTHLKEAFQESSQGSHHTLCNLDMNGFKIVNDACGHAAGDELLKQLSARLLSVITFKECFLGRVGGDEFGLLLKNCELDDALEIANKVLQVFIDFKFKWEDAVFEVGVSIGIVPINNDINSLSDILAAADAACAVAKNKDRNCIHVYHASDKAVMDHQSQMSWVNRIQHALEYDNFRLFVQLIQPSKEKDFRYVEVLLRLVEGDELISPFFFIPAAERYHIMTKIDRWVINNTFEFFSKRIDQIDQFAINLSGQSMAHDDVIKFVEEKMKYYKIPPTKVCFEITETAAINNIEMAIVFMKKMKALGCSFALDDFGSGMSSFGYLKKLPIDRLKIDGSIVRDIVEDKTSYVMVDAINRIGHAMGLSTVAEFVSEDEITKCLHKIGVDYFQGYAIGMPEPIEDHFK